MELMYKMEFSRVNKNTIRCVLSEEEMQERGIQYEDFIKDKTKIQSFFEEIVDEARRELDYEGHGGTLAVQMIPMPGKGMVIMFSEGHDLDEMENTLDGLLNGELSIEEQLLSAMGNNPLGFLEKLFGKAETPSKEKEQQPKKEKAKCGEQIAVFAFDSISRIEEYVAALHLTRPVKSQLYKMEDVFYLVIEKNRISAVLYGTICRHAMEYGSLYSQGGISLDHLREHGICMIEKNALTKLSY